MTWATIAAVLFARAAAQARVASVRAGLAARAAITVSLAALAGWTATGGRHTRRLGHAGLVRAGAMLVASLAAASRGLDWVGAELQSRPPRARLAAGRAALTRRTGAVGTRTAHWLVAAADAIDRAEPVARVACERAYVAACRRAPGRRRRSATGNRDYGRPGFEGWLARRTGAKHPVLAARPGSAPTLEELEADLVSAYPSLDDEAETTRMSEHRRSWEAPTSTRWRVR
jgi:hypothetical protein